MAAHTSLRAVRRSVGSLAYRSLTEERAARDLANNLAEHISNHTEACSIIADGLDAGGRLKLLRALAASESLARGQDTSIDKLFEAYDKQAPFDYLDRNEFQAAVLADRAARTAKETTSTSGTPVPSSLSIAVASSIPFVGMGAVDNSIMLVAGSEIDAVFGAKLGLSTLAAAGLGNMVSDIAGVSMANRIENLARKSGWVNAAALKASSKTRQGQAAKLTGAVVGVAVGCMIGMAPLLFMDTHDQADKR